MKQRSEAVAEALIDDLEESFEHSVPSGRWFMVLLKKPIESEGKKLGAFSQGLYLWAQKNGDSWSIVNREKRQRVILTKAAAKRHVETIYVPRPLEAGLAAKVKGAKADTNPAIAEWMRSEEELTEETILVKPEDAGWFEGTLISHIMRDGTKLADFHKRLVVAVRKEGEHWHVVNPKGASVRLTKKAYDRYVDPIFVPKMANPIEDHALDAVIGVTKRQPEVRIEAREALARELHCYLRGIYARTN